MAGSPVSKDETSLSSSAPVLDGIERRTVTRQRRPSIVEHMKAIEKQDEEVKQKVEEAEKMEERALETGQPLTVAQRVTRLRRNSLRASRKTGITKSRILLINDKIFLKQLQLYMQNAAVPFVKTKWQDRENECMPGTKDPNASPEGSDNLSNPWNRRGSSTMSDETSSIGSDS